MSTPPITVSHTRSPLPLFILFFFFNDTATTEIYTLSLHDALPISAMATSMWQPCPVASRRRKPRSEEHTSELQSRFDLVCRLLLEKKKTIYMLTIYQKKIQKKTNTSAIISQT